ncbi:MAG: FMN-binding protein [Candidatus Delongbacteria bacterium]
MKTTLHMLATLLAVGLLAGASLALVSGWAQPIITENETRAKLAAVMDVVPGGASSKTLAELAPGAPAELDAYQVLDAQGQVLGWAVVGEGTGFADKIRLIVGLSPDLSQTVGLKVLKDNETPGLGTKIREGLFPDQFFGRAGRPAPVLGQTELKVVKSPPAAPQEIQAITGATISSKAVVRIINASVQALRAGLGDALPATQPTVAAGGGA